MVYVHVHGIRLGVPHSKLAVVQLWWVGVGRCGAVERCRMRVAVHACV